MNYNSKGAIPQVHGKGALVVLTIVLAMLSKHMDEAPLSCSSNRSASLPAYFSALRFGHLRLESAVSNLAKEWARKGGGRGGVGVRWCGWEVDQGWMVV